MGSLSLLDTHLWIVGGAVFDDKTRTPVVTSPSILLEIDMINMTISNQFQLEKQVFTSNIFFRSKTNWKIINNNNNNKIYNHFYFLVNSDNERTLLVLNEEDQFGGFHAQRSKIIYLDRFTDDNIMVVEYSSNCDPLLVR